MRYLLLLLLLFPLLSVGQTQKTALTDINALKKARLDTMASVIRITKGDIVADIGSGNGYNLIRLSQYFPPVKYYAEDLDSSRCNRKNFQQAIKTFNPGLSIDSIVFSYGTTVSTGLPKHHFTRVLMVAVVHEFDEKEKMFTDIKSILQPGGFIFIEEPLVLKPMPKDKGCNNPYLTEAAFRKVITGNGLEITEEKYIKDAGSNKYRKIFKCSVKG